MAKVSGIVERFFVNQYDLSGDIGAIGTAQSRRNQQDVTTLLDTAVERLGLLRDGELGYTAFFDTGVGQEHLVERNLPQSALFTWTLKTALGSQTASLVANTSDRGIARGQDGSLVVTPTAMANGYGLQWGVLLTAGLQTFASAAAGTSVNDYVPVYPTLPLPSAHGWAAYLHAISLGSGTATLTVQDSADDISFANLAGGGFTAITGATSERIQSASSTAAVRQYLRVNVTGTFTDLVCVVSFVRYVTGFGMN